jgi:hypothetical protein
MESDDMRYRLRTLLVLLAILPPLLAVGWSRYAAWKAEQERRAAAAAAAAEAEQNLFFSFSFGLSR